MNIVVAANSPQTIPSQRLRITEIFLSIQGESTLVGWPTVFVRLTGCPLRCGYCDTQYAFYGGEWRSFDQILTEVRAQNVERVCVTGGEPLAQKSCIQFLKLLCNEGFIVSLETSGALDISNVDVRVIRVVDVKTPGSGECEKNLWSNFVELRESDQIKFVLCSRADYEWSRQILQTHEISARCTVLFSPCAGVLDPRTLAEWIIQDRLPVRFQVQMHKLLWGNAPGH